MVPTLLLFFLPLLLLLLTFKTFKKKPNQPPSPPKLPFIGNLLQLGSSQPHRKLHELSRTYGPLMFLQLGCIPTLVVSSAELAKEIMKGQDSIFANRPTFDAAKRLLYGTRDVGFAPYGEHWRQVKKICVLHLLSAKKVESLRHVREEEVGLVMADIARRSSEGPVNMTEILYDYEYDVVCRVATGKKYSEEGGQNKVSRLTRESSEIFGAFNVRDFFPSLGWVNKLNGFDAKVERQFRKWDAFLDQVIREREEGRGDLLDALLALQKDPAAGFEIGEDEIKGILMDVFGGGTDTSYVVLEWAMAELVKNPEKMRRAQEEIRKTAGEKKEQLVTEEDADRMTYLKAVIKEVMRLHPPAPLLMPREAMQDTTIKGYPVPAKTRVIINGWALGREPDLWHMPEEFEPERFLSHDIDFKGQDFKYIPFGSGRRLCPGILFAMSTVELMLANLLHRFDWELPFGKKPEELDMAEAFGLTTSMRNKLLLHAKRRVA